MRTEVRRSEQDRLSVVSRHEIPQRKREQSVVTFTHKTHSSKLKAQSSHTQSSPTHQLTAHRLTAHQLKNSPTQSSQTHHSKCGLKSAAPNKTACRSSVVTRFPKGNASSLLSFSLTRLTAHQLKNSPTHCSQTQRLYLPLYHENPTPF